jgi:arylsulfatase A-like enzyme
MLWVYPEYGGQVCVRLGDLKVLRTKLKTASPGPWEVYDLRNDSEEKRDLAKSKPEAIDRAIAILRAESNDNPIFPLPIPGR